MDTVLPSSLLEIDDEDNANIFTHNFKNFGLKGGVIINTYDIDDESNKSGMVEYDVIVVEQDGCGGATSTKYPRCKALEGFGSISDFFEFKRRQPKNNEFKSNLDPKKQNGSFVLILCRDGCSDKGIIIGGLAHPKRETTLTKEAGTHMESEFNGLNIQINKDGEFLVKFNSASDNDGKYSDEEAGGTYIKIDKTGSIDISDGNTEFIKIDKTEETIAIEAAKDISVKTQANVNIEAKANISMKMKDLIAEASGQAEIKVAKVLKIDAKGGVDVKGKQFKVVVDSMAQIEASTVIVKASSIMLGNGATAAVTMMTKFMGTGNLGVPVIVNALGPYSPSVKIAT